MELLKLNTESPNKIDLSAIRSLLVSNLSWAQFGSYFQAQKRDRRSIRFTSLVARMKHKTKPFKETTSSSPIAVFADLSGQCVEPFGMVGEEFQEMTWESSESALDVRVKISSDILTMPTDPQVLDFCQRNKLLGAYKEAKFASASVLEDMNVVHNQESKVTYPDEGDEKIVFRAIVDNSIDAALEAERMFYREFYQRVSVPQRFYFVFNCTPL